MKFSVKLQFNLDSTDQAREIILTEKNTCNAPVNLKETHKDLGMILDSKLICENLSLAV